MTGSRTKLEIRGVNKRFVTDKGEVDALQGIELDIHDGDVEVERELTAGNRVGVDKILHGFV